MAQAGNVILGRFDDLVRMYKAPPAHALTEHFYEKADLRRGFARGFAVQTVGPLPIAFAKQMMAAKRAWGWGLRRVMMDYNHWSALGLLGEVLPWEDNRIELANGRDGRHDAHDRYGLPVAQVTFNLHENDKRLIEFGKNKVMEIMRAAGATEVEQELRWTTSCRGLPTRALRRIAGSRRGIRPHLGCAEFVRDGRLRHADAGVS